MLHSKQFSPDSNNNNYSNFTKDMEIIGKSRTFIEAYNTAQYAASQTDTPILLTGETGTGKDVFARFIHSESSRKDKPFVAINCATLTDELLQSELFGHVKGAFTGAINDYKGKIRMAHTGALFLDEIGDMNINLQSGLLRVLEDNIVTPLGSEKSFNVDIRIIAATNRDLKKAVEEKTFREDLYYRLDVININLPPLRERIDDIPLLVEYFSEMIVSKSELGKKQFDEEVVERFREYPWPGNIRQLKNVLEKLILFSGAERITLDHLPRNIRSIALSYIEKKGVKDIDVTTWFELGRKLGISINAYKEFLIIEALKKTRGNVFQAALTLKSFEISRQNVRTFMKRERNTEKMVTLTSLVKSTGKSG